MKAHANSIGPYAGAGNAETDWAGSQQHAVICFTESGEPSHVIRGGFEVRRAASEFAANCDDRCAVVTQAEAELLQTGGLSGDLLDSVRRAIDASTRNAHRDSEPHLFSVEESDRLAARLERYAMLVRGSQVPTPYEVGMIARALDRFCCECEGIGPNAWGDYQSEHFDAGYIGTTVDDDLQSILDAD